ncbi:AAA family ATPase [Verminephrobacter aporrectodeae subsp. tuberculatae]|uniref:ATP-binding protein n=1 Tax=Verminephrobacter aporrectodeae TaxID=1110389 RepID=UPI0003124C55|nr:ATP-binding protein [Verminephrobacter aporrectodeae]MCW8164828.1 AAA family ATPase [Verminephrobacter aporrectodeae subsp. tuberculatae]MCW8169140.1 AAA family ATPase [Verminephrobacter aporrectodeae subsp. tuberculatae]
MSRASQMPAWANTIREKYLAGEAATFVLYRNVFDVFLVDGEFHDLKNFLTHKFAPETKPTVIEVSPEFGVNALKNGGEIDLGKGDELLQKLHILEPSLRTKKGIMVYVPYADAIMPGDDAGFVSAEERKVATLFHRWSLDRQMNAQDNITFIVVEALGSLNQGLLGNPKVAAIEIPMPDQETRLAVVNKLAPALPAHLASMYATRMAGLRAVQIESLMKTSDGNGMGEQEREKLILKLLEGAQDAPARAKRFAGITAGMTATEIVKLVEPTRALPEQTPDQVVLRLIQARKRELIEKECAGLIEFVEPKHGLSAVGGIHHIKDELNEIAKNLREGDTRMTPMGLLAVGPMGAGKTFVLKAFLKEAGLSAVALKNFRSKWVGSTERNLERVLATVKAMGPIAVLIDEGDRSFGSREGEGGDDGTSSRVIARLKEFMSDTDNRGNVLFILLTNRPDKLDTDIKRPGRLDRKVPFFYAETGFDRGEIVQALITRYGFAGAIDEPALIALCENLKGYSNADLEALVLLAIEFHDREQSLSVIDALTKAAEDFMPPQERDMIDFMELLAVSETSRRSLLPERFRTLELADIQQQLRAARRLALGH